MTPLYPSVFQINVSDGGVPKLPVPDAYIGERGIEGDRQRNFKIHGGPDRAVCLYSLEQIQALQAEGHSIAPGLLGENITLVGLDWAHIGLGDRVRIGEAVLLEMTSYTTPCKANAQWFSDQRFQRIWHQDYPGWSRLYARVLCEGIVRTGDRVTLDVPLCRTEGEAVGLG